MTMRLEEKLEEAIQRWYGDFMGLREGRYSNMIHESSSYARSDSRVRTMKTLDG